MATRLTPNTVAELVEGRTMPVHGSPQARGTGMLRADQEAEE
jgi:hypothetical protein